MRNLSTAYSWSMPILNIFRHISANRLFKLSCRRNHRPQRSSRKFWKANGKRSIKNRAVLQTKYFKICLLEYLIFCQRASSQPKPGLDWYLMIGLEETSGIHMSLWRTIVVRWKSRRWYSLLRHPSISSGRNTPLRGSGHLSNKTNLFYSTQVIVL